MPAKIITLSQKDQDLLRVALTSALAFSQGRFSDYFKAGYAQDAAAEMARYERIKDLKERIL